MQEFNQDFNNALNLCEKNFSHADLISFLKKGNVIERQFAALNLNKIQSIEEANILMSNLVGVDGKIREAAALKICELTNLFPDYFSDKSNYKIFADATIDIDGNVCRLAINSATNLINDNKFSKFYANQMINIVNNALGEISKFTFRDKKYKINKQIFKIYWCLEALCEFYSFTEFELLKKILTECANLSEYTIREKCAKLLCKIPLDNDLVKIKKQLIADENYYVRNIFNN